MVHCHPAFFYISIHAKLQFVTPTDFLCMTEQEESMAFLVFEGIRPCGTVASTKYFAMLSVVALTIALQAGNNKPAVAETTEQRLFYLLPRDTQKTILEFRSSCRDKEKLIGWNEDKRLRDIDLNGDGSRDIFVDWEKVACGEKGYSLNTTGGFDVEIYKQVGRTWKKVFSENVGEYFLSLTYERRLKLLAVSVLGGNSFCKPLPLQTPK
jgi:hypothetical protein